MTEVNPADMWAYATRPIAEADANEPLLAVLEAADAAEPRVVRASRGAMVDGRFEVPPRLPDKVGLAEAEPAQDAADRIAAAQRTTRRDVAAVIT